MRIEKFHVEHMRNLLSGGIVECGIVCNDPEIIEAFGLPRQESGMAWTGLDDQGLIGCAGLDIQWPGVAEAWAMFSPRIEDNIFVIVKVIKKWIAELMEDRSLHRIQCHVREDHPQALRFVQVLGFKWEGTNIKFTQDGADCFEFAIVR